jgi:hypothetical protein
VGIPSLVHYNDADGGERGVRIKREVRTSREGEKNWPESDTTGSKRLPA